MFAIALLATLAAAQPPPPPLIQEPQTILLWPNGAPGALGADDRDKPAITVYMPPNTTGPMTAVIVAPGGSYARLSMNLEGRAPARDEDVDVAPDRRPGIAQTVAHPRPAGVQRVDHLAQS